MPPLPIGLSAAGRAGRAGRGDAAAALVGGQQEAAARSRSSASWSKSMSSVESNAGLAGCSVDVAALVVDACRRSARPSSDGAPVVEPARRRRGRRCRRPAPSTQSVTFAPVVNWAGRRARSRTRHGSAVPRGLSSVKSFGVPRSSNAPFMSSTISAAPRAAGEAVVGVDLELVAAVDAALVGVALGHLRASGSGSGRPAGGRRRAWPARVVPAGKFMHEERSTTSKPSRSKRCGSPGPRSARLPSRRRVTRVGGHGVGDVRALRIDVHRVRLADVARQPDLDRVRRGR